MTGRHNLSPPMRADDPVAPGIRRFRAAWITAVGLALVLAAIVNIVLVLDNKATTAQKDASLSSDEVRELREFLSDRSEQRDAERRATQEQLDDQRRALCTAIQTLSAAAKPRGRAVLDKAANDLACARLSATPNASTSRAGTPRATPSKTANPNATRSAGAPGSTPTGTLSAAQQPRETQSPAVRPSPAPQPAPATSAPVPPKTPIPAAPPAEGAGLLAPITGPVCDLLGVCR